MAQSDCTAPDGSLQWGRDQLIAEIEQFGEPSTCAVPRLQWGRDQLIAEINAIAVSTSADDRLQWGRDQLIAEMCDRRGDSRRALASFNGAAIS